jgi:fructose transport system ATP-binding protein
VAIARAAGFAKKLIILDEPTAALGVQETARVETIIKGLKERGVPLIIISHNLRQVFDLVDRIWVFRQGRIIGSRLTKETSPEEIVAFITGAKEMSPALEATTC